MLSIEKREYCNKTVQFYTTKSVCVYENIFAAHMRALVNILEICGGNKMPIKCRAKAHDELK